MEADVISRSEGTFVMLMLNSSLSVCVFLCVTYLFYYNVTTLTPLYVRPLLNPTTESDLKQRRELVSTNANAVNDVMFVDQAPVRAAVHGRLLLLEGLEQVERNVLPTLNNLLENREMQVSFAWCIKYHAGMVYRVLMYHAGMVQHGSTYAAE